MCKIWQNENGHRLKFLHIKRKMASIFIITKKIAILLVLTLIFTITAISQTPPPPNGGNTSNGGGTPVGGGAPLDGGLLLLIGMGVAYGTKSIKKENLSSLLSSWIY